MYRNGPIKIPSKSKYIVGYFNCKDFNRPKPNLYACSLQYEKMGRKLAMKTGFKYLSHSFDF